MKSIWMVFFLLFFFSLKGFALRCIDNRGIGRVVEQGDNIAIVLMKCSDPDYKYSKGILLDEEIWVYSQDNGMIYSVDFLQGQVNSIDAQRL
jgi:hypothetical protein